MKDFLPPDTPRGQRDAVSAGDKTITVEAGAGTGKTWVLSQRYLHLLLNDEELLPQDILTLTYTEAAAGEMKARIERLIAESADKFTSSERRQNVIDGLSDSWISTIHSFAARLIRESGLSLDIDPRAAVISAHQEQAFWEDVKNAAEFSGLGRLARNYAGGKILKSAEALDRDKYLGAAVGKWRAGTLSSLARNVAELHASEGRSWEDMLKWADDDSGLISDAGDRVAEMMMPEFLRVWHLWQGVHLSGVKKTDMAGNALMGFLDRMRADPPSDGLSLLRFYDQIANNPSFVGRSDALVAIRDTDVGGTLSEWRRQQPAILKEIAAGFSSPLSQEEANMRKTLLKFCAVSWGIWDSMKSSRGLLSFSDMILHAGRTIKQKGIRKTFKHILVDEFQDTDRLQFQMIESLKDYDGDSGLFAVGDPKQSIYKFRHADPSLFAEVIGRSGTKRVSLDTSFRTRSALLSRINAMFTTLWPDGISRQASMRGVKYNSLEAEDSGTLRATGTMPDFRVYLLRNDSGAKASREILAAKLAAKISSWVSEGRTVWDKEHSVIRPVKFSDFAVLSRGRGCFTALEEALERYGIPSVQDRSNDYFSRGEIGDIVCTLRAAADFGDDFSVMGWLMSPFSGVSEDDAVMCLTLVDKNRKPSDVIRENFPEVYSRLEYLSVVGKNEGASGIIALYDRNRTWLSCCREKDRLRVLRNVRLSLKIAREFESSATSSLVSCAEYMTRSIRNESAYEESAWHDENENAVRLGAVHSAKGLEYPVTVIFSDRVQKKSDTSPLKASRDLGLVFGKLPDEIPHGNPFKSKLSDWHKLLSEQGDSEEEERLFYVACTRAQDSLMFFGLIKPGNASPEGYPDTWSEFMLKSLSGTDGADCEILVPDDGDSVPVSGHDDAAKALTHVQTVKAERALRQISATSFALYEWCPYAWRRKYRQGRTLTWEHPERDNEADDDVHGGAALGSLAHWVLSRWPKTEDYESELDSLLYDRETLGKLPGYLRDTWRHCGKSKLREWLLTFAESPLGVKLRNTQGMSREHPFRISLDDRTAIAGIIDAVCGNFVADYKITAISDVPDGLYDSQMDFYALAVNEQGKFEAVTSAIAFLKENAVQERIITDFSGIRERIERAAAECASGKREAYSPSLNHCGECPFKKGCVKNAGRVQE